MPIQLPFLQPGETFPDVETAQGDDSPTPGLLAAGGDLSVATLKRAYSRGIFPWNSEWQPPLWWSPDPRMVLRVPQFRIHRSFRKTLKRFTATDRCAVRMNTAFEQVLHGCAFSTRQGQSGTWLTDDMLDACQRMHHAGYSHTVETWADGKLIGGLYLTCIGHAVYGESMFSTRPNASKIALAALVCFCALNGVTWIDCQQQTAHLHSLGAREIPRQQFSQWVATAIRQPALHWHMPDNTQWLHFIAQHGRAQRTEP